MQARALQDFLLLMMYNPINRKEMLCQDNWQWAFYPMLSNAYSKSEKNKKGETTDRTVEQSDCDVMQRISFQDIYPISLKLLKILLFHACKDEENGWYHIEQFVVMSSFSKNGDVINYEILSGVLEQFGAEITSNLQKDLDWASPSAHSSPTSNSPSTHQRQLPLILSNLTGVSIIIEYFILSGCQSFDGEPVAPTERISTRSTRSESDLWLIKNHKIEEIPSSDTRLYEDNTFLKPRRMH